MQPTNKKQGMVSRYASKVGGAIKNVASKAWDSYSGNKILREIDQAYADPKSEVNMRKAQAEANMKKRYAMPRGLK